MPTSQSPDSSHATWRACYSALVAALVLRSAVPLVAWAAGTAPAFYSEPDTAAYVLTSESLYRTSNFERAGEAEVFRTPGYPLLLVPGVAMGHIAAYAIALQIVLGVATVALAGRLAWIVFEREDVAGAAAWLAALEPIAVLYSSKLLSETAFAFLFVASVTALAGYLQRGGWRELLLAAALLAAATYVRPAGYYFAPLVAALLGVRALVLERPARARSVAQAVGFAVVTAALLVPWQVRNNALSGYAGFSSWPASASYNLAAVVRSVEEGESLLEATNNNRFLDDVEFLAAFPAQQEWTPAERFAWRKEQAWPTLAERPALVARVWFAGVGATLLDNGMSVYQGLLGDWIPRDDDVAAKQGLSSVTRVWRAVRLRPQFVLLYAILQFLLVGYIGLALVGATQRPAAGIWPLLLVVAAIAYLLLLSGGPFGSHRMRLPAMPLIAALAGMGIYRLRDVLCARREKRNKHGQRRELESSP